MARTLLGTKIRESRRSKKITQVSLAQQTGISASYLNLIEHNRRGIGGKTLLALAKALDIDPRDLSEGADQALVSRVKQASANSLIPEIEAHRTEEFIARFPGFARLIARQYDQSQMQETSLKTLSDQLNSDPYFAEAMHLMLSNITAIHSTAEILVDDATMPTDLNRKFLSNLLNESTRLAQTAKDVLDHFEPGQNKTETKSEVSIIETIFESNNFYISELEENNIPPADYLSANSISKDYISDVLTDISDYTALIKKLPITDFLQSAHQCNFDPMALSQQLDVSLKTILRRFAHLPITDDLPRFGVVECDASGAVIFRKQLPSFSLPRFGGACPLWPIYRSFSLPQQPIRSYINTPIGDRFLTFSVSEYQEQSQIGLPARATAIMAFTADYEMFLPKRSFGIEPNLDVGFQCSVCPRENCAARRAEYLLN